VRWGCCRASSSGWPPPDQGDGPARGLDERLGHHRGRHHRHGQPGPDRRQVHLLLFNADGLAENVFWVTVLGCAFIAILTYVCYVGIEASARTQYFLLGAEIITLIIFSVVALGRVWFSDVPGSVTPSLSWLNPSPSTTSAG
jgi:amino acid transporter